MYLYHNMESLQLHSLVMTFILIDWDPISFLRRPRSSVVKMLM